MTSTAIALIGRRRTCRSLHIIDLETLAGLAEAPASPRRRARPSDQMLRKTWAAYQQMGTIHPGDHVLMGLRSGRCGRLADMLAASGTQLRVAQDVPGVRTALVESVDVKHAARRFDRLVVAGWGEEFAGLAAEANGAGLLVSPVNGMSMPGAQPSWAPEREAA